MRKFILLAILLTPFLICDPNPGAEKIILEINGVEIPEFAAESDGSIHYDLAGLAEGDFVIRAKAGNMWDLWSEWSDPLSDTKAAPNAFGGLRVSSE